MRARAPQRVLSSPGGAPFASAPRPHLSDAWSSRNATFRRDTVSVRAQGPRRSGSIARMLTNPVTCLASPLTQGSGAPICARTVSIDAAPRSGNRIPPSALDADALAAVQRH